MATPGYHPRATQHFLIAHEFPDHKYPLAHPQARASDRLIQFDLADKRQLPAGVPNWHKGLPVFPQPLLHTRGH